jgi:peptide subunit release factor 1 (eRF1)
MPTTIDWDALRDLAAFRAERGRALSLYLDLDPRVAPTVGDVQTRVNSLLDQAARAAGGAALAHEQKEGLKADLDRVRRYLDGEFDRDGASGLAVFAAGLDGVWRVLPLAGPVPDAIRVNEEFLLAPLVPLVGRGDGVLVAVVNREQGRLYRLRAGKLVEQADLSVDAPRRHDQGGWSQANLQRHADEQARDHYKQVADELGRRFRRLGRPRVVIVASEEARPEVAAALSSDISEALIGWASAPQHAGPAELAGAVAPLVEAWLEAREADALARWREHAGRGDRAVGGWQATLEAASDARVELLLYDERADRPACRCPACGRAAAEPGSCPLDGTGLEPHADGIDLAVRHTLAHGGTALAVRRHPNLGPVGGIGALLRF